MFGINSSSTSLSIPVNCIYKSSECIGDEDLLLSAHARCISALATVEPRVRAGRRGPNLTDRRETLPGCEGRLSPLHVVP